MIQPQKDCVVYWIFDDSCVGPETSGYIGVSKDLGRRKREHELTKRFPATVSFKILFSGSENECLAMERSLRPIVGIGWNLARGGPDGYRYGLSPDSRRKLSLSLTGKKRKPFSPEHLANMSRANKGQIISSQTRLKMSASRLGKSTKSYFTEDVRRRMSKAKRGCVPWNKGVKGSVPWNKGKVGLQVAWNKGKKLSAATRKKIGDVQRGQVRGPLSAAHRQKISESKRRKNNAIYFLDVGEPSSNA